MKNLLKRYYLLIIAIIILFWCIIVFLFLINNTSYGYLKKLNQIGTLLNHQDLEGASIIYKEIQSYSDNEVIHKLDYDDFIMRTWLVITILEEDFSRRVRELIALRLQYFPIEKNNAKILSMIGDAWFLESCIGNEQDIIDSIELGFCWMRNKKVDATQSKKNVEDIINRLYKQIVQGNNIQEMNNLGNLIGMYQGKYKNLSMYEYQRILWEKIISADLHFVNWYILLISGNFSTNENKKKDNKEIFDQMKKNYIWDKSQYDFLIPQYAKAFNLKQ